MVALILNEKMLFLSFEFLPKLVQNASGFQTGLCYGPSPIGKTKKNSLLCVIFSCDHLRLQLLYNVRPGSSNKSFGLEVARLAGFPSEVMNDAKVFLSQAEMPLLRGGRNGGLDSSEVIVTFAFIFYQLKCSVFHLLRNCNRQER